MLPCIVTDKNISVYINGELKTISADHPYFSDIKEAIKNDDEKRILELIDLEKAIEKKIKKDGVEDVEIKDGTVYYKGQIIDNYLTKKMIEFMNEGYNIEYLIKFFKRLMQNPSYRVVNNLYQFLEVGNIPITEKGTILTYKKVRKDYKDIYSGTIDNSVGRIIEVPRNQVDENPERTCSYGLHVCSYDYLPHFGTGDGDRVVICEVDPADVVAIPNDYNNTKMRVCKYKVIDELENVDENILAKKKVFEIDDDWEVYDEGMEEYENYYEEEEWSEDYDETDDYYLSKNTKTFEEKRKLLKDIVATRLLLEKLGNEKLIYAFRNEIKNVLKNNKDYQCLILGTNNLDEVRKIGLKADYYVDVKKVKDVFNEMSDDEIEKIKQVIEKWNRKVKNIIKGKMKKININKEDVSKVKSILYKMFKKGQLNKKQLESLNAGFIYGNFNHKLAPMVFDPYNKFSIGDFIYYLQKEKII